MMDHLHFGLTLAAALGSGLIAGAFFAFSTFVMKALSRLPAREGIAALRSIDVVVLNAWFLGVFLGTAVLCVPCRSRRSSTGHGRLPLRCWSAARSIWSERCW